MGAVIRALLRYRGGLVAKLLLSVTLLVGGCVAVEGYSRWIYVKKYRDAKYAVTVHDDYLYVAGGIMGRKPNAVVHAKFFDIDNNLEHAWTVRTNNFGLASQRDYQPVKPPGEFRIVLIGDSFTACVNNDLPWGDILQDRLNADESLKKKLGVESFAVLNFGHEGAGWHQFVRNYVDYAEPFQPDLVLVNFIEADFQREAGWDHVLKDLPATRQPIPAVLTGAPSWRVVKVGGAEVQLHGCSAAEVKQYADPLHCPQATIGNYFVVKDSAAIDTPEKLKRIKTETASRYLWPRVWMSERSFTLARIRKQRITFGVNVNYTAPQGFSSDEEIMDHALRAMDLIGKRAPRTLFLHNPLHSFLTKVETVKYAKLLHERRPEYTVLDMHDYLPAVDAKESSAWYNLPSDGHWSNAGAEVYAETLHRMLRERIGDRGSAHELGNRMNLEPR